MARFTRREFLTGILGLGAAAVLPKVAREPETITSEVRELEYEPNWSAAIYDTSGECVGRLEATGTRWINTCDDLTLADVQYVWPGGHNGVDYTLRDGPSLGSDNAAWADIYAKGSVQYIGFGEYVSTQKHTHNLA